MGDILDQLSHSIDDLTSNDAMRQAPNPPDLSVWRGSLRIYDDGRRELSGPYLDAVAVETDPALQHLVVHEARGPRWPYRRVTVVGRNRHEVEVELRKRFELEL